MCISFLLCMDLQPYSHHRFSKISRTFFERRKQLIIVVFLQCILKEKLPFILINTLLLHNPLLALTDGQNDGQRNKYTCCMWTKGTLFPSCAVVLVFGSGGKYFMVYILMNLEYNTVVVLCQFFGCGGKYFLVLRTYLVYNTVVLLCQFYGCGGKQISK